MRMTTVAAAARGHGETQEEAKADLDALVADMGQCGIVIW
jgi:hypothetical protein